MTQLLKSETLTLRPATVQDKVKIFDWLTNSSSTSEMLGLPKFPDNPVPTWEEFDDDYLGYYFDDSQPLLGRCFILEHDGQEIGQINYNEIDLDAKCAELDIWLADQQFSGRGLGIEAIRLLCLYLKKSFGCRTIYIAPSKRNDRAIRAYSKAGFSETHIVPAGFFSEYVDAVLMVKQLDDSEPFCFADSVNG